MNHNLRDNTVKVLFAIAILLAVWLWGYDTANTTQGPNTSYAQHTSYLNN